MSSFSSSSSSFSFSQITHDDGGVFADAAVFTPRETCMSAQKCLIRVEFGNTYWFLIRCRVGVSFERPQHAYPQINMERTSFEATGFKFNIMFQSSTTADLSYDGGDDFDINVCIRGATWSSEKSFCFCEKKDASSCIEARALKTV